MIRKRHTVFLAVAIASACSCTPFTVLQPDGGDGPAGSGGGGTSGAAGTTFPQADAGMDVPVDIASTDMASGPSSGGAANGTACTFDTECAFGHCVESVCCESACGGKCSSCRRTSTGEVDGKCAPVKDGLAHANDCTVSDPTTCGLDGKCDGAGACRRFGANTICRGERCLPGTSDYSASSACDGTGQCVPKTGTCGRYQCAADGVRCRTGCATDGDCTGISYCDGNFCVARLGASSLCSRGEQCASGLCGGKCCEDGAPCICTQHDSMNLLENAGFDKDLSGWDAPIGSWQKDDAQGCPFSGSYRSPAASGYPRQCVQVDPLTTYNFGATFKVGSSAFACDLVLYNQFNCAGDMGVYLPLSIPMSLPTNMWTRLSTEFRPPAWAQSALVGCDVPDGSIDQMFVTPIPGHF